MTNSALAKPPGQVFQNSVPSETSVNHKMETVTGRRVVFAKIGLFNCSPPGDSSMFVTEVLLSGNDGCFVTFGVIYLSRVYKIIWETFSTSFTSLFHIDSPSVCLTRFLNMMSQKQVKTF